MSLEDYLIIYWFHYTQDTFLPEEYGVVTELYAYVAFLVIILTYGLETAFLGFLKQKKIIGLFIVHH